MNTPSDRVQARSAGELRHPGACALCGNPTCIEGYVDLDIYFDYEGNIYLCMNCVAQVINVVGGLLPKEADHLREISEEVANELKETKEKLNAYADLESALSSIFSSDVVNSHLRPSVAVGSDEQPEQVNSPDTPSEPDGRESVATESVKSKRPHDSKRPTARDRAAKLNV